MIEGLKPFCWVIPGDDNAHDNGFLDAMAWQEGEFTKPLYDKTELRALLAERDALRERNEWRPIETAPKTGEHILVAEFNPERIGFGYCGGKKQSMMTVAHWWDNPGEEGWYCSVDSTGEYSFPATHWKPLYELYEIAEAPDATAADYILGLETLFRRLLEISHD